MRLVLKEEWNETQVIVLRSIVLCPRPCRHWMRRWRNYPNKFRACREYGTSRKRCTHFIGSPDDRGTCNLSGRANHSRGPDHGCGPYLGRSANDFRRTARGGSIQVEP